MSPIQPTTTNKQQHNRRLKLVQGSATQTNAPVHVTGQSGRIRQSRNYTYLLISALFNERVSGLELALQDAVVSILLVDLFPVRVHLHHQLRVPLLQPAPRRVRALNLRLHLRELVQQAAVLVGHRPVVEKQYDDDQHQKDEDEGRDAASPSVSTEPNHFKYKSLTSLQPNELNVSILPTLTTSVYVTCRVYAANRSEIPTLHTHTVANVKGYSYFCVFSLSSPFLHVGHLL